MNNEYIRLPKDTYEIWRYTSRCGTNLFSVALDIFLLADSDTNVCQININDYAKELGVTPDKLNRFLRTLQSDYNLIEIYERKTPIKAEKSALIALRHNNLIDFYGEETYYDLPPYSFSGNRNYPAYRKWRQKCLIRDSYKCQKCGCTDNLHVYHIKPYSTHPKLATTVSNGITLCTKCHKMEHRRKKDG